MKQKTRHTVVATQLLRFFLHPAASLVNRPDFGHGCTATPTEPTWIPNRTEPHQAPGGPRVGAQGPPGELPEAPQRPPRPPEAQGIDSEHFWKKLFFSDFFGQTSLGASGPL